MESNLKWACLKCDDNDPNLVTFMAFEKRKRAVKGKKKWKTMTFATVICNTEAEEVIEVHYHKWAFRETQGIERVRQCMRDNEWPVDRSKEFVTMYNFKTHAKFYKPLGEYLEGKVEAGETAR